MPGLKDKLLTDGSPLSIANGATPITNPLATQQSTLHANGNQPGYSLDGSTAIDVISQYNLYVDGVANIIPQPSLLDLDGDTPPQYLDNLPE
jgi:hypothetical protein